MSTYSCMLIAFGFSVLASKMNIALRHATYIATILVPSYYSFPMHNVRESAFCQYHRSIVAESVGDAFI